MISTISPNSKSNVTVNILLFNRYKKEMIGKRVDFDWAYKFQCVDLVRDYAKYVEYPNITTYGDAIDLWSYWLWDWYTRVKNSLSNNPPVWAIVFWKQWDYGHVAIAGRSNLLWMEVLEQNWVWKSKLWWNKSWDWMGKNAIRLRKDFYHNCLGWFIPKK